MLPGINKVTTGGFKMHGTCSYSSEHALEERRWIRSRISVHARCYDCLVIISILWISTPGRYWSSGARVVSGVAPWPVTESLEMASRVRLCLACVRNKQRRNSETTRRQVDVFTCFEYFIFRCWCLAVPSGSKMSYLADKNTLFSLKAVI